MSVSASLNMHLGGYRIMDIVGVYLRRGLSVFDCDGRAYIITSDGLRLGLFVRDV